MKDRIKMTQYVERNHKPLQETGIVYLFPMFNGYGRQVGEHKIPLESQLQCFRRAVFKALHKIRDYRRNGREDLAEGMFFTVAHARKNYKKYWKIYLKEISK